MPDAVPGESLVGVRGVLAPGDPFREEPLPELAAPEREEGADDAVRPAGSDAPPRAAEAALEMQEDRLRLVLERVAGREERPRTEVPPERDQGLVSEAPCRRLEALAPLPEVADRKAPEDERRAERRREVGRGARVPVPLDAPELVVDVEEDDRNVPTASQGGEEESEGGGVAPARAGGDERGRAVQDPRSGDVAGKGVRKGLGAARRGRVLHSGRVADAGRAGRGGGDGRTRTADTGLMRPPLYRLSYIATSRPQSRGW